MALHYKVSICQNLARGKQTCLVGSAANDQLSSIGQGFFCLKSSNMAEVDDSMSLSSYATRETQAVRSIPFQLCLKSSTDITGQNR